MHAPSSARPAPTFDPFEDRVARGIRNSLSSALVAELTRSPGPGVAVVADRWAAQQPAAVYRQYVEARQRCYARVLAIIRAARIVAPRLQAVVLWNAGLYFEVHELLETVWPAAVEPEHSALKGWIQAAGAYLHHQRGKPEAARRLGQRARRNLQAGAAALGFIVNLDQLIQALAQSVPPPVQLQAADAQQPIPGSASGPTARHRPC